MEVAYKPSFVKKLKKLPLPLQEEVFEKIELFKEVQNHEKLHVHKLHGRLSEIYSFSVNYKYRITFEWEVKNEIAVLLAIGDHSVYSK